MADDKKTPEKPRPEITHTAIVHPPTPPRGKKGVRILAVFK
ncbi:hypothetical protein P22_1979 [Propionispora sp. 2/2-37]|nr:hypothetical protein [Propionispora sp. 2/2-37]CUH95893.1 hypothetical protein P22_1979 [Propionispora sp. 2/2-37]